MHGQVAVVTGASRGIGRAVAERFHREGARLCLIARSADALEAARAELGGKHLALAGDVGDEAFVRDAFARVEKELGPPTLLVNNAGVVELAKVSDLTGAQWDAVLDANLKGAFLCAREAVRRMVPREQGRIVSVSSISATMGTPKLSAYCASKWGLEGFIKALAEELRGTGVLSMGVSPGSVDTEMLKKSGFPPAMTPDDVATVVRFLAVEAPAAMQGSIVEMFG